MYRRTFLGSLTALAASWATAGAALAAQAPDRIAYRRGDRAFEHKGTNGLLTTLDMTAADFAR